VRRDLGAGQALGDEDEDLRLVAGESGDPRSRRKVQRRFALGEGGDQPLGEGGREQGFARGDDADALGELRGGAVLEEEAAGAAGFEQPDPLRRLVTVGDLDAGLGVEQHGEALADHGLVVGDEHPDGHVPSAFSRTPPAGSTTGPSVRSSTARIRRSGARRVFASRTGSHLGGHVRDDKVAGADEDHGPVEHRQPPGR
jgi:hypothetical protein